MFAVFLLVELPSLFAQDASLFESATNPRAEVTMADISRISDQIMWEERAKINAERAAYEAKIKAEKQVWEAIGLETDEEKKWQKFHAFYAFGRFKLEGMKTEFLEQFKRQLFNKRQMTERILKNYPTLLLKLSYSKREIDFLAQMARSDEPNPISGCLRGGITRLMSPDQALAVLGVLKGQTFSSADEADAYLKKEAAQTAEPAQ